MSPTAHVSVSLGESMIGVGGLPAWIGTVVVSVLPAGSLTRSRAV